MKRNVVNLQSVIDRFGEEMVTCTDKCDGICRDQAAGFWPRGLHLERASAAGRGCLAIGQNAGPLNSNETGFFRESEPTYASVKEFYDERLSNRSRDYF